MNIERIILNIPHASPSFPYGKDAWGAGIDACIERWTDWHTDALFIGAIDRSLEARIQSVVYSWSRFFCDVERLENDPLEAVGQGIIYTDFEGVKRQMDEGTKGRIMEGYKAYMSFLKSRIFNGGTLLLDCHSFPADLSEVEVCIGFNEDWSKPEADFIELVAGYFVKHGYSVGINNPYTNSISPETGFEYKSMMIELNKATYMEGNALDVVKAEKMKKVINGLYKIILGYGK